jgi:flagellar basal body-associated protein FliL
MSNTNLTQVPNPEPASQPQQPNQGQPRGIRASEVVIIVLLVMLCVCSAAAMGITIWLGSGILDFLRGLF